MDCKNFLISGDTGGLEPCLGNYTPSRYFQVLSNTYFNLDNNYTYYNKIMGYKVDFALKVSCT